MMEAEALVAELGRLDVVLSVREGKLVCNSPPGALTHALRERLVRLKPQLVTLLAARQGEVRVPFSTAQARIHAIATLLPHAGAACVGGACAVGACDRAARPAFTEPEIRRSNLAGVKRIPYTRLTPPQGVRRYPLELAASCPSRGSARSGIKSREADRWLPATLDRDLQRHADHLWATESQPATGAEQHVFVGEHHDHQPEYCGNPCYFEYNGYYIPNFRTNGIAAQKFAIMRCSISS